MVVQILYLNPDSNTDFLIPSFYLLINILIMGFLFEHFVLTLVYSDINVYFYINIKSKLCRVPDPRPSNMSLPKDANT